VRFHSCISDEENTDDAVEQIIEAARGASDVTSRSSFSRLIIAKKRADCRRACSSWTRNVPWCSAEGVIGEAMEVERKPGLALLVGSLPGVRLHPFRVAGASAWRQVVEDAEELRDRIGMAMRPRGHPVGDRFRRRSSVRGVGCEQRPGAASDAAGMDQRCRTGWQNPDPDRARLIANPDPIAQFLRILHDLPPRRRPRHSKRWSRTPGKLPTSSANPRLTFNLHRFADHSFGEQPTAHCGPARAKVLRQSARLLRDDEP